MPFEMYVTERVKPRAQVMRTADYNYARSAALRRVSTSYEPRKESEQQPVLATVEANGDVLFSVERIAETAPDGTRSVFIHVTKDWNYEDSPYLNRRVRVYT